MSRILDTGSVLNFFLITLTTSVNVLFGLLKFINVLDIRFYHFYTPKVVNIVIFSPSTDSWIWIASLLFIMLEILLMKTLEGLSFPRWAILPCLFTLASLPAFLLNARIACFFAIPLGFVLVSLLIYYSNGYLVARREEAVCLTLACITGSLMFFELASVSSWMFNVFDYEIPFGSTLRWSFPRIDLQLFNVLYPLTSWLFLVFLYTWIWIPALKYAFSRIEASKYMLLRIGRKIFSPVENVGSRLKLNSKFLTISLLLSLATAAFVAYYPYIHLPSSTLAGADSIDYYDWMKEMMRQGPVTALEKDRPFFNLLMYFTNYVVGSPETVIRIMPMILAVCLSLAVFWFVKVGTGNERLALLSSLLSTFSFQTTLSVFAYIAANWLAIIETFLLLVFLLKYFEKRSWKCMLTSALIGIALLLTHPYTWNVVIAVLAVYLALIFLRRKSGMKIEVAPLVFLLATNSIFYVIYNLMPFSTGVGNAEESVLHYVTLNIGISSLLNLQNNLASMVQIWVGGLLGNPLLIILAIVGMFAVINFKKRYNRMMLLWIAIPSLALLATPPDLYYRIIYLIPMQIPAAEGLYWILGKLKGIEVRFRVGEKYSRLLEMSLVALVALFLLNYALRSVDEAMIHVLQH